MNKYYKQNKPRKGNTSKTEAKSLRRRCSLSLAFFHQRTFRSLASCFSFYAVPCEGKGKRKHAGLWREGELGKVDVL